MTEGPNKPTYVPPSFSEQLEQAGMRYDVDAADDEEERISSRQKRRRNRHKNNRRDSNNHRPKEVTMVMNESGEQNSINENKRQTRGDGPDMSQGLGMMVSTLEKGLGQMNETLSAFGSTATVLNKNMDQVLIDAAATREEVRKRNEWSPANIKGDLRTVAVHLTATGVIAAAVALISYAFRKPEPLAERELPTGQAPNAQANGAAPAKRAA